MIWVVKIIEDGVTKYWRKPGVEPGLQSAHTVKLPHDDPDDMLLMAESIRATLGVQWGLQAVASAQAGDDPVFTVPTFTVTPIAVSIAADGTISEGIPAKPDVEPTI